MKEDSGAVSEHSFRWSPVIHVSGRPESLHELEVFLTGSVSAPCWHCQYRQGDVVWSAMVAMTPWRVLNRVPRASSLMSIARAIADRGLGGV